MDEKNIKDCLVNFLCDILKEIKQTPQLTQHYIVIARGAARFAAYIAPEQTENIHYFLYNMEKQLPHTKEG